MSSYAGPADVSVVMLNDGIDLDSTTVRTVTELQLHQGGVALAREGDRAVSHITIEVVCIRCATLNDRWWFVANIRWTEPMWVVRMPSEGHLLREAREFKGPESAFMSKAAIAAHVVLYTGAKTALLGDTREEVRTAAKARIAELVDGLLLSAREGTR